MGDQRSGSTLLDYLLNWHPDAVSVGELTSLTKHYFKLSNRDKNGWACHCGELVSECSFWNDIVSGLDFSENFETQINYKEPFQNYLSTGIQKKNLEKYLNSPKTLKKGKEMAENYWKLYDEIYKKTGKSVIIDSSKNGLIAYLLNKYKRGNIKIILLERDIEAVAVSKVKRSIEKIGMRENHKVKSFLNLLIVSGQKLVLDRMFAMKINKENQGSDAVCTVDYMELTKNPQKAIDRIADDCGLKHFVVPTRTNEEMPEIKHAIGGSPTRNEKREIKPDMKYQKYLAEHKLASLLTKLFVPVFNSRKEKVQ